MRGSWSRRTPLRGSREDLEEEEVRTVRDSSPQKPNSSMSSEKKKENFYLIKVLRSMSIMIDFFL